MFRRLRLISAALYVHTYVMTPYLTTWECSHQTHAVQHGDINASTHAQSIMGSECSNDHKGRGLCNIADEHPLALRTECSTTPKWRSVIPSAYMHVSAFTPHQCSFVRAYIRDDPVFNHMRVLSPDACGATRRHQRIHTCAEYHGVRVLKRPQGTRALQYCGWTPTSSAHRVLNNT